MILDSYATIVFDCDGVILNSNNLKSDAFRKVTLPYGHELADTFVEYHRQNGGFSRQHKFSHLLDVLVPDDVEGPNLQTLLENYAGIVRLGLHECKIAEGLDELRAQTREANWLVVSGGNQEELHKAFKDREIFKLFDGGVFGNPDSKHDIIRREISNGNIRFPALLIGDSRYDHVVASENNIDFIFLYNWTDFKDWKSYCKKHNLRYVSKLSDLKN